MAKPANLTHQVSRALAWNTILAPLKTILELISNIVILNILPLPHVGLLRLVSSAAASLGIWVDFGIDRSLPRFIPEVEQKQGRKAVGQFITIIFIIKSLLLLIFSLAFLLFSHRFTHYLIAQVDRLPEKFAAAQQTLQQEILHLTPWLIATVLILVILGSFYDGLMAYLISYFRQRAWNLIGLVGNTLQPILAAALVLLGKGIGGVLIAMVITPLVSVALAGWQVLSSLRVGNTNPTIPAPDTPAPEPESHTDADPTTSPRTFWKRFALYTGMSNVLNVSDYLVSWYFAAFLLNNLAQVALYTTGTAMVRQALALLYTPLVGIQVPFFTRVRGGESSLPEAYATIGRILACILIPGGVGLVLLARELILVQYPDYTEAALVVSILTPCLFLESFLSSSQIVLQVYERYRLLLLPRALTILFLPLLVWVAPKYGLVGVTLAIGGGRVIIALVTAILAQRAFPLRYSWAFFGRVILATMAMAVLVVGLQWVLGLDDTIGETLMQRLVAAGQLLGIAAVGAGSFVLALRAMGGLEPEDRQRILESRLPLRRWLTKLL